MELAIGGLVLSILLFTASGFQLHREADRIKRQVDLVLSALEVQGFVELARNKKGEITGIAHVMSLPTPAKLGRDHL